jgi:hypothetical protein
MKPERGRDGERRGALRARGADRHYGGSAAAWDDPETGPNGGGAANLKPLSPMQSSIAHSPIARVVGFSAAVLMISALGLTACSSSTSAPTQTDSAAVIDTMTGFAIQGGGMSPSVVIGEPTLGDNDASNPGQSARGFVTFDLSGVPANAHVRKATLTMTQCQVAGAPYTSHGNVILDHIVFTSVDTSIYGVAALATNVATLSSDTTLGPKMATVTTSVANDLGASRTTSQFRVRWSLTDSNNDGVSDVVAFNTDSLTSGGCAWAPGVSPTLTVQFLK